MASNGTRTVLAVAGWVCAAAAATAVGIASVTAIGSGIADSTQRPFNGQQVAAALARPVPPTPPAQSSTPGSTSAPGATPGPANKVLASAGGSVVAACSAGKAQLLSWTPRQGYRTDDIDRGPDRTAKIEFESADTEITVRIDCANGVPTAHTTLDTDGDNDGDGD
ncbi:hypothetical protein [Sciscionella sediminilitoris]|uniref:hypothetical protein n=1 Tax=Sciscionella sediminilitoris TaxID=1445613 RepID=UPI000567DC68|nr:hypothetical protein [Sciscionella sp. SE31]